ncbi:transposase [Sphaerisporangium album]|uniref:Transposase n=1 Tax=Sphaerisporangium album TaxID=509200 RepID=A0A367FNM6_9ACTN|nr:transposase [Sphaerisporangium album]RCG32006.1 transposase [Sphaerisporangium album]
MSVWVGSGHFTIDRIVLNGRQVLRIRQYGFLVAYARSVADVARHVDLADLVEVVSLPARKM